MPWLGKIAAFVIVGEMLQLSDISLRIGRTPILSKISFEISQGENVGIIGPNGSGKTSLFNCLSGFLLPYAGSVTLNGRDITHLAPFKRAEAGLGRIFQNFGIFKEMTVAENILLALESRSRSFFASFGAEAKRRRERSLETLKMVGLEAKAEQKAGSLSGGQMRLLEIARALAYESEVFLLDEPTAGVSPRMKEEVERVLNKLRDLKKTILIIEHDLRFIQKLCGRILVLDDGALLLDGTPENVRSNPLLQEIYFGSAPQ